MSAPGGWTRSAGLELGVPRPPPPPPLGKARSPPSLPLSPRDLSGSPGASWPSLAVLPPEGSDRCLPTCGVPPRAFLGLVLLWVGVPGGLVLGGATPASSSLRLFALQSPPLLSSPFASGNFPSGKEAEGNFSFYFFWGRGKGGCSVLVELVGKVGLKSALRARPGRILGVEVENGESQASGEGAPAAARKRRRGRRVEERAAGCPGSCCGPEGVTFESPRCMPMAEISFRSSVLSLLLLVCFWHNLAASYSATRNERKTGKIQVLETGLETFFARWASLLCQKKTCL